MKRSRNGVSWTITSVSVLIILAATLSPFRFAFHETLARENWPALLHRFLSSTSNADDRVNNIILFMPLGFGVGMVRGKRAHWLLALLQTVLIGTLLSTTVEFLQLFLPTRVSTLTDVLTNSFGTGLGLLAWWAVAFALHSPRQMLLSLALYAVLAFGMFARSQAGTQLSNWDESYPLLVGNERTGDRAWRGQVFDVTIVDRALPADAIQAGPDKATAWPETVVLAAYRFTGQEPVRDQSGHLPDLVRQGEPPHKQPTGGATTTGHSWFSTETAASALSRQLATASQFTLITTIASAKPDQHGPARIVSLSANPSLRNFTLGQEGTSLVFRLRTPGTGQNGVYPQFNVPGVFSDTQKHQLAITYDGATIRLYVDGKQHPQSIRLTKELVLFANLLPPELRESLGPFVLRAGQGNDLPYQLLYQALVCLPIGMVLAVLASGWRRPQNVELNYARTFGLRMSQAGILVGFAALSCVLFVVAPALINKQQPQFADMCIHLGLVLGMATLMLRFGLKQLWPETNRYL